MVQLIPCELLNDELVIRLILIERFDDVVPIPPRVFDGDIELEARAIGIANYV